jgi:hypothetical protein
MKKFFLILLMIVALGAKAQNKDTIAYMVFGDDEIRHYYIGLFISQFVEAKYPSPYDFTKTMTTEADKFLSRFSQNDSLTAEQLSTLVQPINELITRQFNGFMSNYAFRNDIIE